MKRLILILAATISATVCGLEPVTIDLFPSPPAKPKAVSEQTAQLIAKYGKAGPNHVMDVAVPTMTIYPTTKPNGTCVIVAPGGGYMFMSYQTEGSQVCEWLNTIGITAVLLKYRVPTRDEAQPHAMPVEDARQAMHLVRSHSAEWKINPKRVGLLGFSAGGNILGHAAFDLGERPDFGIMVYGGGFLDPTNKANLRPEIKIPDRPPPMFFVVAHDDKSNPEEAIKLYLEYKHREVPADLHIYSSGGHGFGMRKNGQPINDWPQRCAEWLESMNLLSPADPHHTK